MTMENEFAKRDWITGLWEETRFDETARDFLFECVIEDLEERARDVAEEREDRIKEELRDEFEAELMDDPPEDLRAKVIKGLIEYPPNGMDEALGPWKELEAQIRDRAREDLEDEIGDLRMTIELLREEIARYKGQAIEPPPRTKRGKR